MVVCVSTLTHMHQPTISTSVIRAQTHTMQVYSIAHTYHSQWFVRLVKTPSSQKSALRLAMVWSLTHSWARHLQAVLLILRATSTIVSCVWTIFSVPNKNKKINKLGGVRPSLF